MIEVRRIQIPSLPTKKPRRLYIYLPKSYETTDRRYPVLYMFDGHNVFFDSHATYGKSWGMKEYLRRSRLPLILVAVECNPEGNQRLSEYSPWDFYRRELGHIEGRGQATMDYITESLKPKIDETYRTLPDREHTLLAGSSMGGLMSLYGITAYNHVFSRAAALSPSLWVDKKALWDMLKASSMAQPTRVYLDYGSGEAENHPAILADLFTAARRLTLSGAHVEARVVPNAFHSEAYWEKRIPVFMDYLLK